MNWHIGQRIVGYISSLPKRILNWAIENYAPLYTELDVALSVEAIIKSIRKCETYGQLYAVEKAIPSLLYDRYMYADYMPYLHLIRDALQRKSIMLQTGVEI